MPILLGKMHKTESCLNLTIRQNGSIIAVVTVDNKGDGSNPSLPESELFSAFRRFGFERRQPVGTPNHQRKIHSEFPKSIGNNPMQKVKERLDDNKNQDEGESNEYI